MITEKQSTVRCPSRLKWTTPLGPACKFHLFDESLWSGCFVWNAGFFGSKELKRHSSLLLYTGSEIYRKSCNKGGKHLIKQGRRPFPPILVPYRVCRQWTVMSNSRMAFLQYLYIIVNYVHKIYTKPNDSFDGKAVFKWKSPLLIHHLKSNQ